MGTARLGARFTSGLSHVHPVGLMVGWIITLYVSSGTPLWALWRPLAIGTFAVLVIQLFLTLVLRRRAIAALLCSILVLSYAALWYFSLPLLSALGWWLVVNRVRRRQKRQPLPSAMLERWSANMGFVVCLLLVVMLFQAGTSGAIWNGSANSLRAAVSPRAQAAGAQPQPPPDIYLIMLDGYPGLDAVRTRFGVDNSSFARDLQGRDFDVSAASRSNYTMTLMTLASMFQMTYVQDLPALDGVPRTGPGPYRALSRLINEGPALNILRDAGYRLVTGQSAYSDTALTNLDEILPAPSLTRLEEHLIEKSAIGGLAGDWILDRERADLDTALNRPAEVASQGRQQPIFMFDHVFSPHPPFLFQDDGSPRHPPDCFPTRCALREPTALGLGLSTEEYGRHLAADLNQVNRRVLEAVDQLTARNPDAVVVVFSDHGTRHDPASDPAEAIENFFAVRAPGAPNLFGAHPNLVNLFPVLFNRYLGTTLPTLPHLAWLSFNDPLILYSVPVDYIDPTAAGG